MERRFSEISGKVVSVSMIIDDPLNPIYRITIQRPGRNDVTLRVRRRFTLDRSEAMGLVGKPVKFDLEYNEIVGYTAQ